MAMVANNFFSLRFWLLEPLPWHRSTGRGSEGRVWERRQ